MKIHPLLTLPGWQNDLEGKPIRCNAIKNFSEAPSMILFKKNLFTYNAVTYIGQQKSHLYRKWMGFRIRQRWVWVSALFSLVVTKPLEQVTTSPNLSFFSKIQIIPPRFQVLKTELKLHPGSYHCGAVGSVLSVQQLGRCRGMNLILGPVQ